MSFSLIYICCSFRGGILSVVFPTVAICFWPAGNLECPCLFSDLILFPFLLRFSSILFLTLPFLLCPFHWSISAVVSGEAFYLSFSLTVKKICFWPAWEPGRWPLVSFSSLSSWALFSSTHAILFLNGAMLPLGFYEIFQLIALKWPIQRPNISPKPTQHSTGRTILSVEILGPKVANRCPTQP